MRGIVTVGKNVRENVWDSFLLTESVVYENKQTSLRGSDMFPDSYFAETTQCTLK